RINSEKWIFQSRETKVILAIIMSYLKFDFQEINKCKNTCKKKRLSVSTIFSLNLLIFSMFATADACCLAQNQAQSHR
ncbi:TPA: hypothetical protein ACMUVD_003754, partial [Enterobacter kobei]